MAKPRRKSTPPIKSSSKPKAKAAPVKAKSSPKPKAAAKGAAVAKAKPKATARSAPKPQVKGHTKVKAPEKSLAPAKAPVKARPGAGQRPAPPAPPLHRSTYVDAVAMYERGVRFLQARQFKEAADALRSVISLFPEEKELHERALLYIKLCERSSATATPPKPESAEDRVFAATLAINNGALEQAIGMLTAVLQKDPEHDQAAYMLGVAYALRGNTELALQSLARSMALNRENRDLAYKEPDLEVLRRTDEMRALLVSPPAQLPRKEHPPAAKPRR